MQSSHLANQHFENEDAKAPPVHGSRVRWICQHFGSQELRCPTEGARSVTETHPFFAETKIRHLDVAFRIEQQIVQLEVTREEKGRRN